jgi:hypothetical protein
MQDKLLLWRNDSLMLFLQPLQFLPFQITQQKWRRRWCDNSIVAMNSFNYNFTQKTPGGIGPLLHSCIKEELNAECAGIMGSLQLMSYLIEGTMLLTSLFFFV